PGQHTLAATYSGSDAYLSGSGSTMETVTCTKLSAASARQVTGSGCVLGAIIAGPITVTPGGSLALIGATVTGPITVTGAKSVLICGSALLGRVSITNPAGQITIGGAACATNALFGPLTVTGASA